MREFLWAVLMGGLLVFAGAILIYGWAAVRQWFRDKEKRLEVNLRPYKVSKRVQYARDGFQTAWTDVDEFVKDADRWWPYLKNEPTFWVGVITSTVLVMFAVAGGWALGGGSLFYGVLMAAVFGIVNIAQAVVSIAGDRGTADFHQVAKSDRSVWSWATLALLLVVNFFGAFVGAAVVGQTMTTSAVISSNSVNDLLAERERVAARVGELYARVRQSGLEPEGIEEKAKFAEEKAICESWLGRGNRICPQDKVAAGEYGPRCGEQCQELRTEAVRWRALANDAAKLKPLQARVDQINARLAADGGARTEALPAGRAFEELTAGAVTEQQFGKWSVLFLQWIVAVIDFLLWLRVGDMVGAARLREQRLRAEIGNAKLSERGEPARYMVETTAALPAPEAKTGDQITMSVAEDPSAKIAANANLTAIKKLFDETMRPAQDSRVTSGTLYNIYVERQQIAKASTWMAKAQFLTALDQYTTLLAIEYDGSSVIGYKLGVVQEAAE